MKKKLQQASRKPAAKNKNADFFKWEPEEAIEFIGSRKQLIDSLRNAYIQVSFHGEEWLNEIENAFVVGSYSPEEFAITHFHIEEALPPMSAAVKELEKAHAASLKILSLKNWEYERVGNIATCYSNQETENED